MTKITVSRIAFLLALLLLWGSRAGAQLLQAQTDVPRMISYQGIVTQNGAAVSGEYPVAVRLYSDADGKHVVWEGTYTTNLTQGVFNIMLGSGNSPLPDASKLNRPLWVGVAVSGGTEMRPLSQLASSPYALNVPDKSITKEKLSDELQMSMTHIGGGQKGQTWDNANGGTNNNPGDLDDFIGGGRDNSILSTTPLGSRQGNVIAGGDSNYIENGTYGSYWATICGGARNVIRAYGAFIGGGMAWDTRDSLLPNHLATGRNSFIGGGSYNTSSADYATIVGGELNIASGDHSFIGGGGNTVGLNGNKASGDYSTIGGGQRHHADADRSFIGGGDTNTITSISDYSAIGGGKNNKIDEQNSFIGGGSKNFVEDHHSMIGGGDTNYVGSPYGVVGGGQENSIATNSADYGTIAGGVRNKVNTRYSFLGGGELNTILTTVAGGDQTHHAVIGGGMQNTLDTASPYTVIVGGLGNVIFNNSRSSAIGGGDTNAIVDNSPNSTIAGGWLNTIDAKGNSNTIGGGHCNWLYHGGPGHEGGSMNYSTIGGGYQNRIWRGNSGFIGGGYVNKIDLNSDYGTIGGGYKNLIDTSVDYSFIGGGSWNKVQSDYSAIGGGRYNLVSTISPHSGVFSGRFNRVLESSEYSFIGGGDTNTVSSARSVIVGGCKNLVQPLSVYAAIGGGCGNTNIDSFTTIAGGAENGIFGFAGSIGGGTYNIIDAIDGATHADNNEAIYGTIGGGASNLIGSVPLSFAPGDTLPNDYTMPIGATIAGGIANTSSGHFSNVGGGQVNFALGFGSSVIGGIGCIATDFQTVTGRFNKTTGLLRNMGPDDGSFVPPDPDSAIFVVGNGGSNTVRSDAFRISENGHSTVFHTNGTSARAIKGTTYTDNVIYAWGEAQWNNTGLGTFTAISNFGCSSITRVAKGNYLVELDLGESLHGATDYFLGNAAVTATLEDRGHEIAPCMFINVTPISSNKFNIKIYYGNTCSLEDHSFAFQVTGR